MALSTLLRVLLLCLLASLAGAQTISTVAGGGTGDGGAATQAFLNLPFGIVGDSAGNIYIADQNEHRIRKVTPQGIISTFAGNGLPAYADATGTQARFNFPSELAIDSAGNIYVADSANNRIRKIDPSGLVSTIAGTGTQGDSGDGGLALNAQFRTPFGVAVDAQGNVYISDSNNHRIRRVDRQSGIVTTIAGTGAPGFGGDGGTATAAQLSFPLGLAIDGAGNLYIADSLNFRIRKVDASGRISTFAGTGTAGYSGDGGPATAARVAPQDVMFGPDGNLYSAEALATSAVVRRIDAQGVIRAVAGRAGIGLGGDAGAATSALLYNPSGVFADNFGRVFIADSSNHRVRVVENGIIRTIAGGSVLDGLSALEAGLATPSGVRADALGRLFVADTANHRVRRIDPDGSIRTIAGNGIPGFSGDNDTAATALLFLPQGVEVDSEGNLYIADTGNHRIRKVTTQGTITTIAGTGSPAYVAADDGGPAKNARISSPTAVAIDGQGNVFIADRGNRRIRKIDAATGNISTFAGNGSATLCGTSLSCGDGGSALSASFAEPRDLVIDKQGNIYVVDGSIASTSGALIGGFRVRRIDPGGIITTVAGNGQLTAGGDGNPATSAAIGIPSGIALDPAGALFISDERNHRIRKVIPGGNISTLAGSESGYAGDGGPASSALISRPRGLAMDAGGRLLIADSGNQRIRRITDAGSSATRRLVLVSGGAQSGPVGGALPQPLVVGAFGGVTPLPGVVVQFAVAPAGSVKLSATQATTNENGQASVTATFEGQPGESKVTATANFGDPVVFTLRALPAINTGGAVNGASFSGTQLAPGTIVSLFGQGLAKETVLASVLPLPTTLGTTRILIRTATQTIPAPLFYVSPLQINFMLPFGLAANSAVTVVVEMDGLESPGLGLPVQSTSPGIFTVDQNGSGGAIALHADFTRVTAEQPVRRGEVILVYCTGLGAVTPAVESGAAAPSAEPLARTNAIPIVTIGGIAATVEYSGLAPGFAGLYQINIKVPDNAPQGSAVHLVVTAGGRTANLVTLPVQ